MTSKTVTFQRPFILTGFDGVQPAGKYTVETEEEQLDTVLAPAWKKTITIIHLKKGITTEYQAIDPGLTAFLYQRDGGYCIAVVRSRWDNSGAKACGAGGR